MDEYSNISYIFIPFMYNNESDFKSFVDAVNNSGLWEKRDDEISYMFKYISDKIVSTDEKSRRCFHYRLKEDKRSEYNLATYKDVFSTEAHSFRNQKEKILFRILNVQLYFFSTTVGIMAFKVYFENDDPFWIANAQYYLKKVSREQIFLGDSAEGKTMCDIAKELMRGIISEEDFFYYANDGTERANILTYVEVKPQEDYRKELFYLRNCYKDSFYYLGDEKADADEIHSSSKHAVWGISPEAAVCLVCPKYESEGFKKKFYNNFKSQYLFMYVLLLHQKYALYMFLMKIGVGRYNTLETLENYRGQLYEFETDFVFSCVTEVPQYQNLYERIAKSFALEKMYKDVHEPLISLGEVRREAIEKEKKRRDDGIDRALLILSALSFCSALVDSFQFVDSFFGWFLNATGVKIAQVCCIVGIISAAVLFFKKLHDSKK